MSIHWTPIMHEDTPYSGRLVARVELSARCLWFSGHFPDLPVFPGVAMLALVEETMMNWARTHGRDIEILGFNRTRFIKPGRPGDELEIDLSAPGDPIEQPLPFEIRTGGATVCRGRILVREKPSF